MHRYIYIFCIDILSQGELDKERLRETSKGLKVFFILTV